MSQTIFPLQLFLFSSFKSLWKVRLVEKRCFLVNSRRFWLILGNLRPKYFRALLRLLKYSMRGTPLQFICQKFLLQRIFPQCYSKNRKKLNQKKKHPTLSTLGPNISAHRFFPDMRLVALNSKYSLISNIFELAPTKNV